jgi:hypothetical protein
MLLVCRRVSAAFKFVKHVANCCNFRYEIYDELRREPRRLKFYFQTISNNKVKDKRTSEV